MLRSLTSKVSDKKLDQFCTFGGREERSKESAFQNNQDK